MSAFTLLPGRRNQHELVAEDVLPRSRAQQLALFQVVHPVEVGRDEHLRRRAGLDLLRERRACAVRNRRLRRRHRRDFVERVLQARRGEDERLLRVRGERSEPECENRENAPCHPVLLPYPAAPTSSHSGVDCIAARCSTSPAPLTL
jgi:hypothetical protein